MMSEGAKQIEECCFIDELIGGKLFFSRSYSEKQDVTAMNRPCVPLTYLKTKCKVKQKGVTRTFSVGHY